MRADSLPKTWEQFARRIGVPLMQGRTRADAERLERQRLGPGWGRKRAKRVEP